MTIKTTKDHRAMWEAIAEAFWAYGLNFISVSDIRCNCICWAIGDYFDETDEDNAPMFGWAIEAFGEGMRWKDLSDSAYRLPEDEKLPRGDLAYLFSTMTKEEFETLVEVEYPK